MLPFKNNMDLNILSTTIGRSFQSLKWLENEEKFHLTRVKVVNKYIQFLILTFLGRTFFIIFLLAKQERKHHLRFSRIVSKLRTDQLKWVLSLRFQLLWNRMKRHHNVNNILNNSKSKYNSEIPRTLPYVICPRINITVFKNSLRKYLQEGPKSYFLKLLTCRKMVYVTIRVLYSKACIQCFLAKGVFELSNIHPKKHDGGKNLRMPP